MNLTAEQRTVLRSIDRGYYMFDRNFYPFAPIMDDTGLDRRTVRLCCRALKRKGLAEFSNALSNDDGDFVGAGYGITEEGHKELLGDPVVYEDDAWWFWDETWSNKHGPFDNQVEARQMLEKYAEAL